MTEGILCVDKVVYSNKITVKKDAFEALVLCDHRN